MPSSIITPGVDLLCVGGLSILVLVGYLVYGLIVPQIGERNVVVGDFIVLQALINWPHFIASYRMLYSPHAQIAKHRFASMVVPGLLVAIIAAALLTPSSSASGSLFVNEDIAYLLWFAAAIYLAWHYTGQIWGMVASFSFLGGSRLDDIERRLIRSGLRVLLVWHVMWGIQDVSDDYIGWLRPYFDLVQGSLVIAGIVTCAAGVYGFWRVKKRTGRKPTPQMLAPWVAAWVWYIFLFRHPDMFILVQFSHALQYLLFPMRVESNRYVGRCTNRRWPVSAHALFFYVALVGVGVAVFYLPDVMVRHGHPVWNLAILIAAAVNIHHYFVDGCIWKISNPDVRRELFAHVGIKSTSGTQAARS